MLGLVESPIRFGSQFVAAEFNTLDELIEDTVRLGRPSRHCTIDRTLIGTSIEIYEPLHPFVRLR